jgi:predicted chitinase
MLQVSRDSWRQIFPNAPSAVMDAFGAKPEVFAKAGITNTRTRLAYFCANVEHECGGFTIRNLTENISYTAARMAKVWPNRFSSASAVVKRYGSAPGWQTKAFDDIYGNRMGNHPGTHDGSTFIGRGGPQVTGRDGYNQVGSRCGRDFVSSPEDVAQFDLQPEVCAAFWTWKTMNKFADRQDFLGCVKSWNGGTNGLADRKALMSGNNPIIVRLQNVDNAIDVVIAIDAPSIAPAQSPIHDTLWIQESLNKLAKKGVIKIAAPLETKTGIYGQKTHDAVEEFQRKFNVKPFDGVAGDLTVAEIERQLQAANLV